MDSTGNNGSPLAQLPRPWQRRQGRRARSLDRLADATGASSGGGRRRVSPSNAIADEMNHEILQARIVAHGRDEEVQAEQFDLHEARVVIGREAARLARLEEAVAAADNLAAGYEELADERRRLEEAFRLG
jgi:hypothetical protein